MSGVDLAQPDVALILDTGGVIRKATLSNSVSQERASAWLGRPWTDTVGRSGAGEVQQIVEHARASGVSAFRRVLQRFPSGLELPVEYTTVRVSGRTGRLLAMGKNLRDVAEQRWGLTTAQQAAEQEYWRLRDRDLRSRAPAAAPRPAVPVDALIDRLPDAFAAVDAAGPVLRANRAFLDLVQVAAESGAVGESLGRWLCDPVCDGAALLAALQRDRSVRLLPAVITGELGTATPVEVSAVGNADAHAACYGIVLRDVSRRIEESADGFLAPVLDAAGQVGRAPLPQIVREATEAVERRSIETALRRAGGNRTVAAGLLGVSRQSLHAKLNRYAAGAGPA